MKRTSTLFMLFACLIGTTIAAENSLAADPHISPNEMATSFYLPLAEGGDAYAQLVMGEMNAAGDGVDQNKVAAYAWFHVAASNGADEAIQQKEQLLKSMADADKQQALHLSKTFEKYYTFR